MKFLRCLALLLVARACAATSPSPLVLVSLDGFRWDYCEQYAAEAPTLRALRREGVAARGLIPVFPSNTFPNHYTLVTGLFPANHGIVNNDFFDPERGMFFHYFQPTAARDSHWWRGEPIWVTAIKQGRTAAASFWVGSEAAIGGVRPTYWKNYDAKLPFAQRLEEVCGWLARPPGERPDFLAFYLEETNSTAHRFGPNSPETAAAVRLLDGRLAVLLDRIRALGAEPNVVVVSDHGMTETSYARTILLDDLLDLRTVMVESDGSVVALRPLSGSAADLVRAFRAVPHVQAYLAEDLPARFRLRGSPRVAPVWVLPEEGWHLGTRANRDRTRTRYPEKGYLGGDHGYDPDRPSMRGLFVAHGPAFRRGVELAEVENIHVYNLLCAVLRVRPAPNDGDDRLVRAALRE